MESLFERLQARHVVLNVEGSSYNACLRGFLNELEARGVLNEAQHKALQAALQSREAMGGTGIGRGVVLPHAYVEELHEPLLLFGRLRHPAQHAAPDNAPVDLVFLLCGPLAAERTHLTTLARLVRLLHDGQLLDELRQAPSDSAAMAALHAVEQRHA